MSIEPVEFLRQFLAERDIACPQCDYNLRDLPTNICPECGHELELRLTTADPRPAAAIAGLMGLSAGGGFNALLLLYFVLMLILHPGISASEEWKFFGVQSIGLTVFAVAITFWLRHWRHLRSRSARARWWLVAACWILSVTDLVIFTATIR